MNSVIIYIYIIESSNICNSFLIYYDWIKVIIIQFSNENKIE